ncbi:hypothetical protein GJAV_G00080530 [Gymnothorax javanicus]|nr:hypothetical protein GJAV_G00080530 [Gymnothorax javanicus]
MEQEASLDFKALRAKFQEEAAMRQMKNKPALPEKPKLIPPPGARVSLLSSINAAMENKNPVIPRVVFKDSKTAADAKRRLSFPVSSKAPFRDSNLNTGVLDHQQKKEGDEVKLAIKDRKLPLVLPVPPAIEKSEPAPPEKSHPPKKKSFLQFKSKGSKVEKESTEISTGLTSTSDGTSQFSEGAINTTESPVNAVESPSETTESISDTVTGPASAIEGPIGNSEGPSRVNESDSESSKNPVNTSDGSASISEYIPSFTETSPRSTGSPTSFDGFVIPPPLIMEEIDGEAPKLENGDIPHDVVLSSEPQPSNSEIVEPEPVPDEKADEISTGSRTPPCDRRVLNALENAKRKFSPFQSLPQARPRSPSPVNGEQSQETTPSRLCPELPPIDYDDRVPSAVSVPPVHKLDGISHSEGQSSPSLIGDIIPPPRKTLPDVESLGPSPEKPARPPVVDLNPYQIAALEAFMGNASEALDLTDHPTADAEFDVPECEPVDLESLQLKAPEVPDFEMSDSEAPDLLPNEVGTLQYGGPEIPDLGTPNVGAPDIDPPESLNVRLGDPGFQFQGTEIPGSEAPGITVPDSPGSPIYKESQPQPGLQQEEGHYESCDNVYEDVDTANKHRKGPNGKKRKGPPKNPYADSQPVNEESHRSSWFFNARNERKASPEAQDDKELKKKEKQRLEKEKKEQKEREKKENEMKKKFKITGEEEPMYQAKVILPSKGRKNDLPVKNGDIVSIIRTTDCPKGKWLARDSNNKYGYISVKSVELDIKEMLELGKRASQAAGRPTVTDGENVSVGSRSSNHYPLSACSFTDDSEEWTCDDDDTLSPTENIGNIQPAPVDDVLNHTGFQHPVVDSSLEENNAHVGHDALQKLVTFFHEKPKKITETGTDNSTTTGAAEAPSHVSLAAQSSYLEQDGLMEILPPPELYADSVEDNLPGLRTFGVE